MKTYKNLYPEIASFSNLYTAYKKARKGKTKKNYVIKFEQDLEKNLVDLKTELSLHSYCPRSLKTFVLRDPKTRKISKSHFRDRVVHHALCNIIEPFFDKAFIHDSYANRKGKGNLKALERFDKFTRKVSKNGKLNGWFNNNQVKGYVFKADIKHYFEEINHKILLNIIKKKIKCRKTVWLIKKVINGGGDSTPKRNAFGQFNISVFCQCLSK